jgi:feruloyl esterase
MAYFGQNYFSQMVYGDPSWDYRTFVFDAAYRDAIARTGQALDATDPDLSRFRARGGKLILYHGWQDPAIPAASTVEYFDAVAKRGGPEKAAAFARLYLAPGVQHCGGGPGPDAFGGAGDWTSDEPTHSLRAALEAWVERGTPPGPVIASKFEGQGAARRLTLTRPLCAYPQEARYKGAGDASDASSFACAPGMR